MARVNNLTDFLTDVASAIKTKKGSSTVIPAANFDTEILALPSQGVYQTKETNITTNGNYEITPDTNYDAMDKLRLNVNVPTPQLQTKSYTFTQNTTTTLTPETNYDGFSSVDISINVPSGGSGDVKLFETEQAMQADPNPSEGDLAVVYRSEVQPCTATTHFSKAIFPETVVLDSALEDYVDLRFRPVDDSQMFDCWGMIDQSMFEMSCYGEQGEYRVQYESQDGITYTRTTFRNPEGDVTGNELDFGVEIYYEDEEMWNDVIGEFIQIGGSYFEGLYEYKTYIDKDTISIPLMSGLSNITSSSCDYNGTRSPEFDLIKIKEMARQICIDEGISSGEGGFNITYKNNHIILLTVNEGGSLSSPFDTAYNVQNESFNIYSSYNIGGSIYEYVLDLDNNTYVKNYIGQYSSVSQPPYAQYNYTLEGFMAMFVDYGDGRGYVFNAIPNDVYYIDGSNYSYSRINNAPSDYFVTISNYKIADSQLTLSSLNQLLPGVMALGRNGIVEGDGSLYENLDPAQVLQKVITMEDTQTQHREIYGEQNTNIVGPGFGTGLKPGVLKHYKTISNSNDLGMGFGRLADKSSTTYKLSEDGSKAISFGSLTTGLGATVTDVTTGSTLLEISNAQYLGYIGNKVYYSKMGYSGRSLSAKRYNYGPMTYASNKRDLQVYYLDLETLTETKIDFDMVTATSWKNIEHSILMYGEMMVYISWANTESGTRKEQVIYQVYNTSTNTLYNSVNYTKTMATSQSNNGACVCPDQNRNIYIWHFGLYNSSSSSTMYTDVYKFDYSTKVFTKILTDLVIPSGGYMGNCKGYLTNDNKLFIINSNTNRYLDLTNNTLNNMTVQFQNCSQFFVKPESFNPYSSYVSFDYDTLQYYYKNYLGFILLQPSVSGTTITLTGINCVRFSFPRLYEMAGTYTNYLDWFHRDGNKFIISKMCPYIPTDTEIKVCEECDYGESEFSAINTEINEDWSEQNVQLFKKYQLDDSV